MRKVRRYRRRNRSASEDSRNLLAFDPQTVAGRLWKVLNLIERSVLPRRITIRGDAGKIDMLAAEGRLCGMPRISLEGGADTNLGNISNGLTLEAPSWHVRSEIERSAVLHAAARVLVDFCENSPALRRTILAARGRVEVRSGSFSAMDLARAAAAEIYGEPTGTIMDFWNRMRAEQAWLIAPDGWPRGVQGELSDERDIEDCAGIARAIADWCEKTRGALSGPSLIIATMSNERSKGLWCMATDDESVALGRYQQTMLANVVAAWRSSVGSGGTR